jgi:transposase-like protein
MRKNNPPGVQNPEENVFRNHLDEIVRKGAQKLLAEAVEMEVESFLESKQYVIDDEGRRLVTGNGHHHPRIIATGAGPVKVRMPRVRDQVLGRIPGEERFTSRLIPPYLRRTRNMEEFIPFLYLKGISTGDFTEVLEKLLGKKLSGFSSQQVCRLKEIWRKEYESWARRDLSAEEYVYWWVDGIYFNVRLDDDRQCVLVIIGAGKDGKKELVAVQDGFRESKESWQSLIRDLKKRGLKKGPKLAVGDGHLGFWAAQEEEIPESKEQICWVHKTANVLDRLPESLQGRAKGMIHDIYLASCRKDAETAFDDFIREFALKYPKAVKSLTDHRDSLLHFYGFPAEHWQSIRSTNVIESTFATVRHRTKKTKGCGSRAATLTMVFKLAEAAEKHWRRLNGYGRIQEMLGGARFVDGIRQDTASEPAENRGVSEAVRS